MSESMAQGKEAQSETTRHDGSILPVLSGICDEEARWIDIDPPTPEQERSEPNIIGNWLDEEGRIGPEGEAYPIKAGFLMETRENSEKLIHKVFRTSKYNVHYRIKEVPAEEISKRYGIPMSELDPDEEYSIGQVYVREAEGYGKDNDEDE